MQPSSSILSYELIAKYNRMGYSPFDVSKAWEQACGDEDKLTEILGKPKQRLSETSSYQGSFIGRSDSTESGRLERLSDRFSLSESNSLEPLNPEEKLRKNSIAVGLKNVGNTCYVNSLLQTYFMSRRFVSEILKFNPQVQFVQTLEESLLIIGKNDVSKRRIEASIDLVKNLQKLFALMTASHKAYVDPTEVLRSVVDDSARRVEIGDQKDITEYHSNFLSRIDDALQYQENYLKMNKKNDKGEKPLLDEKVKLEQHAYSNVTRGEGPEESMTFISKHFFGKMKEFRLYTQNNNEILEENDITVGPIILDISNNEDLYGALNSYCNNVIENFRAPNVISGETVKAEQKLWITRAPEVLVFQLNRVHYNQEIEEQGNPFKVNKAFEFKTEIFLDRFMLENENKYEKINEEIRLLRKELEIEQNELANLSNWLQTSLSVPELLGNTEGFLEQQSVTDDGEENRGFSESKPCNEYDIQIAIRVIRAFKESTKDQITTIKINIEKIKDKIEQRNERLNQYKFHLVSILLHKGEASSGHYYSFNRDIYDESWIRFGDMNVTPEKQDRVMQEATGGDGNSNAYCLVYLSDHLVREELKAREKEKPKDNRPGEILVEKHYYEALLPTTLKEYVESDNQALYAQIESFRFNTYLNRALEMYQSRCKLIENVQKLPILPNQFDSFAVFLKLEANSDKLLKWYILDTCLKETGCCNNFRDLDSCFKLAVIQDKISALPKKYSFNNVALSSPEKDELDLKFMMYVGAYPLTICYKFIIRAFHNKEWKNACYAARRILFFAKMETQNRVCCSELLRATTKVICLDFVLRLEHYIKTNQYKEAEEVSNYLFALVRAILKPEDLHVTQINIIINDGLKEAQKSLSPESFKMFKQEVYKFSTGFYRVSELDKVIKGFECKDLDKEIEQSSPGDFYSWRETENEGPSNDLTILLEEFSKEYANSVKVHQIIEKERRILLLEERKSKNLFI